MIFVTYGPSLLISELQSLPLIEFTKNFNLIFQMIGQKKSFKKVTLGVLFLETQKEYGFFWSILISNY
jgi:hypothetical protein